MDPRFLEYVTAECDHLLKQGRYKSERVITSPQGAWVDAEGRRVINLCANNYLGFANHPSLVEAAREGLRSYGLGAASARFICGTLAIHKELEARISTLLGMEDAQLYPSCFTANGGVFEALLAEEDAILCDERSHASVTDGIRLCKARSFRYANHDMADLDTCLLQAEAQGSRFKLVVTDGVFSMDGSLARLPEICALAKRHSALVMVDDSHGVGCLGAEGRGTHELLGVLDQVDILTGTLGKALGGTSGGYVSSRREIIDWLRQSSRPYLFSNTLAPAIAAAAVHALDLVQEEGSVLRQRLQANTAYFRAEMAKSGFELIPGEHPIIPVMLQDAHLAQFFVWRLLEEGVYAASFCPPVVPEGQARIRAQVSAAHSRIDLLQAVASFAKVGRELGVIP